MDQQSAAVRIVLSTCADRAEADRISRSLVESELAACVNLVPGVESIYRWQGKVELATEVLLVIKTSSQHVQEVEKAIARLHSYAVPEFLVLDLQGGSEPYLQWLFGNLK
jgi:periplasmic divalent cation tolerance protein